MQIGELMLGQVLKGDFEWSLDGSRLSCDGRNAHPEGSANFATVEKYDFCPFDKENNTSGECYPVVFEQVYEQVFFRDPWKIFRVVSALLGTITMTDEITELFLTFVGT